MKANTTSTPDLLPLVQHLIERARQGDAEALQQARRYLHHTHPIWASVGQLATRLEQTLIDLACGNDQVLAEGLKLTLSQMRRNLGHDRAEAMERLLIDRVVLTWLEVHYLDLHAQQQPTSSPAERERRRNTANHRHLTAVKSLAQVRRFLARAATNANRRGRGTTGVVGVVGETAEDQGTA